MISVECYVRDMGAYSTSMSPRRRSRSQGQIEQSPISSFRPQCPKYAYTGCYNHTTQLRQIQLSISANFPLHNPSIGPGEQISASTRAFVLLLDVLHHLFRRGEHEHECPS